jgi:hypothetical protein
MVSAETSLSPAPQSFRQRFPHFIPRADGLVPSALPKLKEVHWSSGTCGMRKDMRIWITVFSFSFKMMRGRGFADFSPHPSRKLSAHTKYEPLKTVKADARRAHDRDGFRTRVELAITMAQATRFLLDV